MEINRLAQLTQPYASKRVEQAQTKGFGFAHYTSADAALSIIRKKELWLRSSVVMNDFSEISHGQRCLEHAWRQTSHGQRLQALLNRRKDGLANELIQLFDEHFFARHNSTYLMSISEHDPIENPGEKLGRLSMWRAYGGSTNVAMVFNSAPLFADSNSLNAFASPVLYATEDEFALEFTRMVEGLEKNFSLIEVADPTIFLNQIYFALHMTVLSTKHPGFAEEREWRILHSPTLWPSERINYDVISVNGVPQKVYKIRLENHPDDGFVGATLPEVLEEIIIGPTQYPYPIYDALVHELGKAGVSHPENKVTTSNIPLRR